VVSRFLDSEENTPVHLRLIGTIPFDPAIPTAISRRQLLSDIHASSPAAGFINQLAESLLVRISRKIPV
jgi:Flp pilus assembly CpaE family ATPase